LYKNNFTPTKASVAADFTEADFSGYADRVLDWDVAFLNSTPRAQKNAGSETFVRTAGDVSNTIYGAYITDAGDMVSAFIAFEEGVSMATEGVDHIFIQFSPTEDTATPP